MHPHVPLPGRQTELGSMQVVWGTQALFTQRCGEVLFAH
jgi:hypothetical protein